MSGLHTQPRLEGEALAFLDAEPRRYATLATVNPDGSPHQAVIWYAPLPDGSVLINSKRGRRWPDNLLRDPRCVLTVHEGRSWAAVRGEAVLVAEGQQGFDDIMALAYRYGEDQSDPAGLERDRAAWSAQERITFHIRPTSVSTYA
ncbi:MAG: pyridoxamine 5'-phosphate oxidase family protein [Chloroflexota bacterium]